MILLRILKLLCLHAISAGYRLTLNGHRVPQPLRARRNVTLDARNCPAPIRLCGVIAVPATILLPIKSSKKTTRDALEKLDQNQCPTSRNMLVLGGDVINQGGPGAGIDIVNNSG